MLLFYIDIIILNMANYLFIVSSGIKIIFFILLEVLK